MTYDEFRELDMQLDIQEPVRPLFRPTYKVNSHHEYSPAHQPAWTDRILINFGNVLGYYSPKFDECEHLPVVMTLDTRGMT